MNRTIKDFSVTIFVFSTVLFDISRYKPDSDSYSMAECCQKPQLTKIVLGISFFFVAIVVVCLMVGEVLFAHEYPKAISYVEALCHIQGTTHETLPKCLVAEGKVTVYEECHVPIWEVTFGESGTLKGTVRGDAVRNFDSLATRSDQYKVGSSHPCWYNKDRPTQVTFYEPNTFYALILLAIGAICIPFAILSIIGYIRLSRRPDL